MAPVAGRDEKGENMARWFKQTINTAGGLGMQDFGGSGYIGTQYLQRWYHPQAEDDDYVLTATALPTVGTTLAAASLTHATLDFPRNLTVVASAAATSHVHVTGVDQFGAAATEALTLNGTTAATGSVIFESITSVLLDARIDGAANVKIGTGSKLGTRHLLTFLPEGTVDGTRETTLPTLDTTNSSLLFNTALSASKDYVAKYWSSDVT
jgi:hypothetical protein